MDTKIVQNSDLSEAIFYLKTGVPIVFPTETVYGLGSCISDEGSIKKVYQIKGRPSDNPLIIHISNIEEACELAQDLPESFFVLAKLFWPGPLTLVVRKNCKIPNFVTGGLDSIAIRMPAHKTALELISRVGPLAAPSANLSGNPSPTNTNDVLEDLKGKIPLIIEGGPCAIGIESTVLSLLGQTPVLLRPGSLKKETLEGALGTSIEDPKSNSPLLSPGMKYRHYAPKAHVRLCFHASQFESSYVLSPDPKGSERLLNEQTLYAELRRADRLGVSAIDIDCCSELLNNQALMNRLLKASSR